MQNFSFGLEEYFAACSRCLAWHKECLEGHGWKSKLTENERNLDLWEIQEVLGNMNGELVQEGWGDVVAFFNVVWIPCCCLQVVFAREDSIVCSTMTRGSLVKTVYHVSAPCDVLLQHVPISAL